jgi:hypothetical protein
MERRPDGATHLTVEFSSGVVLAGQEYPSFAATRATIQVWIVDAPQLC